MFQNLRRTMKASDTLKIRCEACDYAKVWTQAQAFQRFGPDAAP